jgi:hypothetical protein
MEPPHTYHPPGCQLGTHPSSVLLRRGVGRAADSVTALLRSPSWLHVRTAGTVTLLVLMACRAAAQEDELKKALAVCAGLELDSARLDCFEQLTRAATQIPPEPPKPRVSKFKGVEPGKWKVEASTNPIDDSRTVALGLVDDTDSMQLVLLCQHGNPQVYITAAVYLGERGVRVLTRFGEAKAESKRWSISGNRRAASFPGDAAQFIARMLTVQRLVVQIDPELENPITAAFKLGGLPDVMAPFEEICPIP